MNLPYSTNFRINNSVKKNKEGGFTIVELLIVVMVIGILSGIVLSFLNSGEVRKKTRDAQRVSDLRKMQSALELYFADTRTYPVPGGGASGWERVSNGGAVGSALLGDYIGNMPEDPSDSGSDSTACGGASNYRYNYWSDGNDYILTANMEVTTSNQDHECSSTNVWQSNGLCGGGVATICYGVENP